ncbi:MAG: very short patch repair endonuclease [Acidobacteriota bacterium]
MDTLTRAQRAAAMRAVRVKDTAPEIAVRRLLFGFGYRYRLHAGDLPGKPDIVLRSRRCVLFVNGCFWHGHRCKRGARPSSNVEFWVSKIEGNRRRDQRVRNQLKRNGWRVLTIWECETRHTERLAHKLQEFFQSIWRQTEKATLR